MMTNARARDLIAVSLVLAVCAACTTQSSSADRGNFGENSCKAGNRVAVDEKAAYALYLDKDGNLLTTAFAEDLKGTANGMLCPTPVYDENDTTSCPVGYCARPMSGKTYCLRC